MGRYALHFVAASLLVVAVGCASGNRLPSAAEAALRDSADFELLSLDPGPRKASSDGKAFHGWTILGSTAIKSTDARAELIAAFKAGVAENNGVVAACFNPRHGIRVTHDGKTHEFVICFECLQVEWYIDGRRTEGFLITESPQPTFDRALRDAKVPLAEKPGD